MFQTSAAFLTVTNFLRDDIYDVNGIKAVDRLLCKVPLCTMF